MVQKPTSITVFHQYETLVPVFPGLGRFIEVVGLMRDVSVSGGEAHSETHTCQVGPVLRRDDCMGASCLPSIAKVESRTATPAQCVIESGEALWTEDAGRVELRVRLWSAGAPADVEILFSVDTRLGGAAG